MIKGIEGVRLVFDRYRPAKVFLKIDGVLKSVTAEECFNGYDGYRFIRYIYTSSNSTIVITVEKIDDTDTP